MNAFNLLILCLSIAWAKKVEFYDGLRNDRVQSQSYLTTTAEKFVAKVEISNTGNKNAPFYLIAIPKSKADNFAFLRVSDMDGKTHLTTESVTVSFDKKATKTFKTDPKEFNFVAVKLVSPLPSGGKVNLKITMGFMHVLTPLPAKIKKTGKQFVVFEKGYQQFVSPYLTGTESTAFTLASDKVKSYTKPAKVEGKNVRYGPFEQTKPLTLAGVRLHFQFHVPFLTVTRAERDFELSHWGNVRIEETFFMKHDGAKLKGPYEPNAYMGMLGRGDPAAVHELRALLPKASYGVYYRDRIGNISTSKFRKGQHKSILEVKPRYPLYGGWKTDFTIGYDVPSESLITVNPKTMQYHLNISFGIPFRDPVTDELILRVALPEGASDVQVDCPYEVEQEVSRRFTYLDSLYFGGGRPLLIFKKKNVVHLHNGNLVISYKYDSFRIYGKVYLVCGGFFMFFVSIVLFFRIDLSLDDGRDSKGSSATTSSSGSGTSDESAEEVIQRMSPGDNVENVLRKLTNVRFNASTDELTEEIDRVIEELSQVRSKKKKIVKKVVQENVTRLQSMVS